MTRAFGHKAQRGKHEIAGHTADAGIESFEQFASNGETGDSSPFPLHETSVVPWDAGAGWDITREPADQEEDVLIGEFENDFFGAPEADAPFFNTQVMSPLRAPQFVDNPEERPFARGVVLERIERGEEVFPTRRRRKTRNPFVILFNVLIALAFIGAAAGYIYSSENEYTKAQTQFDQAVALVQETDDAVVELDTAVNQQVTADKIEDLQTLLDEVPQTQEKLNEAIEILDDIEPVMQNNKNGDIVERLRASAESRLTMLDVGSQLVGYDIKAMQSAQAFEAAWTLIIGSDTASREAISLVASATAENVERARSINESVLTDLNSALEKLNEAAAIFPEADFSPLIAYVTVKIEAVGYAKASDQAFLDGDTAESEAQTVKYNEADARVVTAASVLPSDPTQIVLTAYDTMTATLRADYSEARQTASDADAAVRNYLGINEIISDRAVTDETVDNQGTTTTQDGTVSTDAS